MRKHISVLYKYEGWTDAPPRETLAATSSHLNSEALAVRVVLAHPRTVFHLHTCGLHRGAAVVAAALIGYDNVKVAAGTTT
jgi:hypothetical protein